ncbi:MAG: sigma-70 family RNA polymerase sigma factor [Bacteroidaceae bacterium]|nr:sigma-70 family RNA polymerase sigma factor [Bacteroidaceae bacterium]
MNHAEFARLAPVLRSKAKFIAGNFFSSTDDAEDVAQETMIRLWKAWLTLAAPSDAERLAVRIAKHECIDLWRSRQRHPHAAFSVSHELSLPAFGEGQPLEERELTEALRRAALSLPRAEQRLWRMFAEAQMQTSEISTATGINVRTVSAMLSHARRHIYNVLKEGGYIDG